MNIQCNNCGKLVVLKNVDKYRGRTMKFKCKGEDCGAIFEHFIPEEKDSELTTVVTSQSISNNYQGNLRITNREGKSKVYKLENGINLIGRKAAQSKADILIESDAFVSKNHCFIERVKNLEFVIFDNDSKNGVFLNNQKLKNTDKIYLKDKDIIRLGKTELEFFYTYNV